MPPSPPPPPARPPIERDAPPCGELSGFLARLDGPSSAELARSGVVRSVRPGEVVFLQGEQGGRVAIIEDGVVKVTCADEHGHNVLLGIRHRGDLVGECDAFEDLVRCATVTALVPARIRVLASHDFAALLRTNPRIAVATSQALVERLRDAVAHRLRAGQPVPVRLAGAILDLAARTRAGDPVPSEVLELDLPLTQEDLASLVDASREAVAKALTTWRRQGIVETARRRLTVLDPERLLAQVR